MARLWIDAIRSRALDCRRWRWENDGGMRSWCRCRSRPKPTTERRPPVRRASESDSRPAGLRRLRRGFVRAVLRRGGAYAARACRRVATSHLVDRHRGFQVMCSRSQPDLGVREAQEMRVAVVSDILGNLRAFDAVLADLKQASPDVIVHGGDLVGSGASPAEVTT